MTNGSTGTAAWFSPQSGALKVNQTNKASAPAKATEASPSGTGGPATASAPAPSPRTANNKSAKAKSKHAVNGSNAKISVSDATQTQTQTQINGTTALAKPAASSAIVEAVHSHNHAQSHSNVNGTASMTDRNEFVREVLSLIQVGFSCFPSHPIPSHPTGVIRLYWYTVLATYPPFSPTPTLLPNLPQLASSLAPISCHRMSHRDIKC